MNATTISTKKIIPNLTADKLINQLKSRYPQFKFRKGRSEHWSPKSKTITYNPEQPYEQLFYGLFHETAHALLGHLTYHGDFELLKLESEAWELASKIAKDYDISIEEDHIQNCLDTYRDWLHRRSTCPTCGTHVLQRDISTYQCFNCQTVWQVSSGRFVRPYRRMLKVKHA